MATRTARVIAKGRDFCECPRWHEGRFWFSDLYAHEVCSVGLAGEVMVKVLLGEEQPAGLGWRGLAACRLGELRSCPGGRVCGWQPSGRMPVVLT